MHWQVHHVHCALGAQRVQAHRAAVAQAPGVGAAGAESRPHLQRRRFLGIQRKVLQLHPQRRHLEGHWPRRGGIAPAHRAALQQEVVHRHFPRAGGRFVRSRGGAGRCRGRSDGGYRTRRRRPRFASLEPLLDHPAPAGIALHLHPRVGHGQLAQRDRLRHRVKLRLQQFDRLHRSQRRLALVQRQFVQGQPVHRQLELIPGPLFLLQRRQVGPQRPVHPHSGVQCASQRGLQELGHVGCTQRQRQGADGGRHAGGGVERRAAEAECRRGGRARGWCRRCVRAPWPQRGAALEGNRLRAGRAERQGNAGGIEAQLAQAQPGRGAFGDGGGVVDPFHLPAPYRHRGHFEFPGVRRRRFFIFFLASRRRTVSFSYLF